MDSSFPTAADYANNAAQNAQSENRRLATALADAVRRITELERQVKQLTERADGMSATLYSPDGY